MINFHKRKKAGKNKWKKLLDELIYPVAFVGPVMTIPQLVKIWYYQNAAGVSLMAWTTYLFISIIWLFYGIVHKEKPIIVSNSIWVVMDLAIIIGVAIYGSGVL